VRGNGSLGKLLLVLACAAVVAGSATRESAQASHCIITPTLAKATVGQGLPYARLVRGKETLVKAYLTLPSTLPRCAGNSPAIKIIGATLTMKNGTTPLVTGLAALPDANGALITSKTTAKNQPADPKFVVRGSQLPPSSFAIAGSFIATFELSVQYQSRGANVQGSPDTFTSTQVVPFTTASGSPISRPVEAPTKALRMLAVPTAAPLNTTMTSTLEAGLTALSAMYPVQDLTGSGQPRVGVLPTTQGGIRYALNTPGLVEAGSLPFCGTSSNYALIQSRLQAFHNAWNDANTNDDDVDRTVGAIPGDPAASQGSPNCFEGFTITNSKEAWVRVLPDAPGSPSTAGSLLGMELCHTFDCTTSTATRHSLYTNADNLAENADLAFNPLTWSWLPDDRSLMRFTAAGWNQTSTILEKGDYGYLLCGLGGANTSGCPPLGTGTLTGVAAGGSVFLLDGTTDDTPGGTTVVNSFASTAHAETTPQPTSEYRFLQRNSSGGIVPGGNLGVPVRDVHSGHTHADQDVGPGSVGAFSFAFPLHGDTARVQLVIGSTVLYEAVRTAAPKIESITASDDGGPILLSSHNVTREAPGSASGRPAQAPSFSPSRSADGAPGGGSIGSAESGTAAFTPEFLTAAATGLNTSYVFTGNGGYSADGLGQNGTGGTIQADVPAGSSVKKAFLYGSYFSSAGGSPDATERTIDFDGTSVETTTIGTFQGHDSYVLTTTRADVTDQVAAKIGSGGGITDFVVNSDPLNLAGVSLDGVGLLVVYANPDLPIRTVGILDGSADHAGSTTTFTYPSPLEKGEGFSATMSLGIGFSFQGGGESSSICGTGSPQSSLVDVNGTRLTSCAGNFDDGVGEDGALITVGGVGDDTANPADPMQQPFDGAAERVQDDELYDITSFVDDGDTGLTLTTSNPSQDDNLFLAVVQMSAQALPAGTVEVDVSDDEPENTRLTCYVDWGGVKYPVRVGLEPTSFDSETDKATFECPIDPDTVAATEDGTARVTVVVHDGFTQATSDSTVTGDNMSPVASIAAAVEGDTFLQFETIVLRGSGLDAEDGHLTGSALTWNEDVAPGPLLGAAREGEEIFLTPPAGGWAPGEYTITLTASDGSLSHDDAVTFTVLADADHDGIPADQDFAGCPGVSGSGDNNPENAFADIETTPDGIPNIDDQYTQGGPCVAETNYAAIIDWNPDDLNRNTSGTPITVKVQVPYRSVSQIVPSSVKITKVIYVDPHGEIAEANPNQQASEWSAKGQDGTAKFARQPFIAFLNHPDRRIANQRIVVEVSGDFSGTPTTHWAGRDSTNVK
jgi:hypothetical protein